MIKQGSVTTLQRRAAKEEAKTKRVVEIVEAGLVSHRAGRTKPHATVARRVRRLLLRLT